MLQGRMLRGRGRMLRGRCSRSELHGKLPRMPSRARDDAGEAQPELGSSKEQVFLRNWARWWPFLSPHKGTKNLWCPKSHQEQAQHVDWCAQLHPQLPQHGQSRDQPPINYYPRPPPPKKTPFSTHGCPQEPASCDKPSCPPKAPLMSSEKVTPGPWGSRRLNKSDTAPRGSLICHRPCWWHGLGGAPDELWHPFCGGSASQGAPQKKLNGWEVERRGGKGSAAPFAPVTPLPTRCRMAHAGKSPNSGWGEKNNNVILAKFIRFHDAAQLCKPQNLSTL